MGDRAPAVRLGPQRCGARALDGASRERAGERAAHPARRGLRPAYARTVETTIYLAPDACGSGVGSRLYGHLLESLLATDAHLAVAGIALPNVASVALHRRLGFERVGTFREVGHKLGRAWDVEWWQLLIGGAKGAVSSRRDAAGGR